MYVSLHAAYILIDTEDEAGPGHDAAVIAQNLDLLMLN